MTVIADQIAIALCNILSPIPGGDQILSSIYGLIPASLLGTLGLPTTLCTSSGGGVFVNALLFAQNEVPSQITLLHVSSSISAYSGSSTNGFGEVYAMFDFDFTGDNSYFLQAASSTGSPTTPAGGKQSPLITGINLTQGLIPTLAIIGKNLNVDLWAVADLDSADGTQSYNIPGLHYIEYNVNTAYFLGSPEAPIPISATGDLIGLLDQLIGDGTINEVLRSLGGLTSANLASIFGGQTGLAGANAAGSALCSALPLLCPAGGLTANTITSSNTILSSAVSGISSLASGATATLTTVVSSGTATLATVASSGTAALGGAVPQVLSVAGITTAPAATVATTTVATISTSSTGLLGAVVGGNSMEKKRQQWEAIKYVIGARDRGPI